MLSVVLITPLAQTLSQAREAAAEMGVAVLWHAGGPERVADGGAR